MKPKYQYSVVEVNGEFAVRADHRQGQLVAFRVTEEAARQTAQDLQRKADNRFKDG